MLRRLSQKSARFFSTIDLTQGYHQAPTHHASRIFAAFNILSGMYQFTRVPFGPKRAHSYFQEQMASFVLAGLLYIICELYLDDITVLRTVLQRLSKHGILLKPSKCFFGFLEVESVEKIISSEGLKMSHKRIQSLLDFSQSIFFKQLKSFLVLSIIFEISYETHRF